MFFSGYSHITSLMTRDNLRKRHIIKPLDCVFCSEESIHHRFFYCIVDKSIWPSVRTYFNNAIEYSYESLARLWISNNKNSALNTVSSAIVWCLWKYRNSMIFNNTKWISVNQVFRLIWRTIRFWAILSPEQHKVKLTEFSDALMEFLQRPLMILSG